MWINVGRSGCGSMSFNKQRSKTCSTVYIKCSASETKILQTETWIWSRFHRSTCCWPIVVDSKMIPVADVWLRTCSTKIDGNWETMRVEFSSVFVNWQPFNCSCTCLGVVVETWMDSWHCREEPKEDSSFRRVVCKQYENGDALDCWLITKNRPSELRNREISFESKSSWSLTRTEAWNRRVRMDHLPLTMNRKQRIGWDRFVVRRTVQEFRLSTTISEIPWISAMSWERSRTDDVPETLEQVIVQ